MATTSTTGPKARGERFALETALYATSAHAENADRHVAYAPDLRKWR